MVYWLHLFIIQLFYTPLFAHAVTLARIMLGKVCITEFRIFLH